NRPQRRKNHAQRSEPAHGEGGLGRTRSQAALRSGSRAIATHRAFTRRGGAAVAVSPERSNHHPGSREHSDGKCGKAIPLSQMGRVEIQSEDPLIKRRDRVPTITVRGDNIETTQPPDVSSRIWAKLAPLRNALLENYRIEMAGSIEEATKANSALAPLFPIMLLLMLAVIIIQVRSF